MIKTFLAALIVAFTLTGGMAMAQTGSGTLGKIKAAKVINVAYSPDSLPFSFAGPNKEPAGYSIDLCKRVIAQIARAVGDTADDRHQRTHVAGLTLARVVNARAMVGVGAKYLNAKGAAADGSEDVKGFNWDLGAVVRLTDQLNLAVVGSNLWGTENLAIARTVAGGATFRPSPQLVAA